MRQITTLFIYMALAILSLSSCKDDFDIDKIQSTPKLNL